MKNYFLAGLKIAALGIIGFVSEVVARSVLPPLDIGNRFSQEGLHQAALMLFVYKMIWAVAIYYTIRVTTLRGTRLVLILFLTTFGIEAVMTQIETVVFIASFPALDLYKVGYIVAGHFVSLLISLPFAVLIADGNKDKALSIDRVENPGIKILIISLVYPIIYFTFGYFVAFRFEAVREFYKNDPATYSPGLLFFIQIFRGGLWVLFILPLITTISGYRQKLTASTLLYGFLVGPMLIIPNPLMPPMVRLGHFLEVTSSMLLFGFLVAWVLYSPRIARIIHQVTGQRDATKSPV